MQPILKIHLQHFSWIFLFAAIVTKANSVFAQASNIVSDNTLGGESSQVIENFDEQPIEVITGGAQREQNLFHSFQEFNVSEGREAYFNSPNADIQNIFSRVTGANPSEIMGVLGTFGASDPNLYLINPNGILFGENASLDVGGSFAATTATGIEFGDRGSFDAINPQIPQLLTIDPSAYLFNQIEEQAVGDIESRADLIMSEGENLVLLGGDINLTGSSLIAPGGGIELGSWQDTGEVEINENRNLVFPEGVTRGDISLYDDSLVEVASGGGGFINVSAQNLELLENSILRAGIGQESGNSDARAGDITINISEELLLDNSNILNQVRTDVVGNAGILNISTADLTLTNGGIISTSTFGQGNAGELNLTAANLALTNRGIISASTFGQGNAGEISINVSESIIINDATISNSVTTNAVGNSGKFNLTTSNISLTNEGLISASTRGQGNGGLIDINASESITLDDGSISNTVGTDAVGNGGKVNITTENLTLSNGGIISTSTFGQGDASDINIATANLTLDNDGLISASTRGQGDGGLIDINASESITLDDGSISNTVGTDAVGNGGKVNITTENLTLSNGGIISTSTFGQGDASDINITTANLTLDNDGLISAGTFSQGDGGLIDIIASELITLDDGSIINNVTANAIGNGGKLNITTENLTLSNDGLISASTGGEGDSGSISIDVTELVTLDNSDILNTVRADAVGNAGEINITTENLALNNGSEINASTEGEGNSGKITIDATESLSVDGIGSSILSRVETEAVGNSGDLNITTSHLDLTNGGQIAVSTFGEGNGGMIFLDATESVILNDGNIFNTVGRNAIGNSGELNITTPNLTMTNDSLISTSTFGKGNAGDVTFMVQETINLIDSNIFSNVEREAVGKGGNLYFTANSLSLEQGAQLQTIVRGTNEEQSAGIGQAGNINLDVKDTITLTGSNAEGNGSSIFSVLGTDAEGKAGNIKINTGSLVLTNDRSLIRSSTFGQGNTGDITITAEEEVNLVGGYIQNNIERGALGEGGELNITANSLSLEQGAQLQTIVRGTNEEQSAGIGHAGNINLDVKDTITLTGSNAEGIGSLITSELGTGSKGSAGNIDIKSGLLTLTDDDNFIRARTFGKGDAGSVTITANEAINIVDGNILSAVGIGGIGNGGNIYISTALLSLIEENGNASISASTFGEGNAGNVFVEVAQSVSLVDGSSIESGVRGRGVGNGGDVEIETNTLSLTNGSQVGAFVFRAEDDVPGGRGNGGNIKIIATDFIDINGINPKSGFSSGLLAISEQGAEGNAGNITVDTNIFRISNSGELSSGTRNTGNGGNIFINANTLEATEGGQVRVTSRDAGNAGSINLNITDKIVLSGSDPTFLDVLERFGENRVSEAGPASGIFSNGTETSTGNAGSLMIDTQQLIIQGEAEIDVSNRGTGNAGDLIIDSNSIELYDRGSINASTESGLGGNINLQIDNSLTLRNDSGISAQALGGADGGNITLSADSIIAFDDSDIFAFAEEGKGGNITLDTPAYFGENFTLNTLKADPKSLENNNRADVNATGAVLGSVSIPDVSFIQNSLNDLPDNSINTNELVANSCVAPVGNRQQGKFIITGGDSLPVRPGNAISISDFDTGEVRSVTEGKSSWQRGDAIVEPQGIYRLANGKLILSRECSE